VGAPLALSAPGPLISLGSSAAAETSILFAFRAFCFLAISYRFEFCFNCMLTSFICTLHSINVIITDNNNIIMGLKSSEEQAKATVDERSSRFNISKCIACL